MERVRAMLTLLVLFGLAGCGANHSETGAGRPDRIASAGSLRRLLLSAPRVRSVGVRVSERATTRTQSQVIEKTTSDYDFAGTDGYSQDVTTATGGYEFVSFLRVAYVQAAPSLSEWQKVALVGRRVQTPIQQPGAVLASLVSPSASVRSLGSTHIDGVIGEEYEAVETLEQQEQAEAGYPALQLASNLPTKGSVAIHIVLDSRGLPLMAAETMNLSTKQGPASVTTTRTYSGYNAQLPVTAPSAKHIVRTVQVRTPTQLKQAVEQGLGLG